MTEKIKNHLLQLLTLPNIVIILSALFCVYKMYISLPKIEEYEQRLNILEKESIKTHHRLEIHKMLLTEMRADVKMMIKNKGDM